MNCIDCIDCFTDSSYSKELFLSVIGYKIGLDDIIIEELYGIKNTEAEIIAAEKCISSCRLKYPDYTINIYTDCQRLLKNNYKNVNIIKIKGHIKKELRNEKDIIFNTVDKLTRKRLREIVMIIYL